MYKKLVLALVILFCSAKSWTYSFRDLKEDFIEDTREVFMQELKTGYYYDFLEKVKSERSKFGISTQLFAWRFIGLEPIVIYTPNSADSIAEFGFAIPLRIRYIPLGGRYTLGDYMPKRYGKSTGKLVDRVYIGIYSAQNLTTGKFGLGMTFGLNW